MKPYEIKGNCTAKRGFEVAAVGGLSVLMVGPLSTSKTTIRRAFPGVLSAERESCLCGHYRDVTRACVCTPTQLSRWNRRMERVAREYDIILEACATPARELMASNGNTPKDDEFRDERVRHAREFGETNKSLELSDDTARRMMEMALRRLSLSAGQYNQVLRVARSIANLDRSEKLQAKHIAEAVQYRGDATFLRSDR